MKDFENDKIKDKDDNIKTETSITAPGSKFPTHEPLSEKEEQALTILERVADFSERINIGEYFESLRKPKRLLFLNFLYGVARGVGFAVGFTLLGAFIVYLLNQLQILNLPLIGDFITELLKYIDSNYGARV